MARTCDLCKDPSKPARHAEVVFKLDSNNVHRSSFDACEDCAAETFKDMAALTPCPIPEPEPEKPAELVEAKAE